MEEQAFYIGRVIDGKPKEPQRVATVRVTKEMLEDKKNPYGIVFNHVLEQFDANN